MIRRQSGVTLLELLVAVAIFTLVAAALYTGLQQGLSVQDRLQEKRVFWRRLESAFNLMERDLDQAWNRSPRTTSRRLAVFRGYEHGESAERGVLIEFTRTGHHSFSDGPVSPYLRIAYSLRDGTLYRSVWPRLDRPEGEPGTESELLHNVAGIRMRYLDDGQWDSTWPRVTGGDEPAGLPDAIGVSLDLEKHGSYERLFHVGAPD